MGILVVHVAGYLYLQQYHSNLGILIHSSLHRALTRPFIATRLTTCKESLPSSTSLSRCLLQRAHVRELSVPRGMSKGALDKSYATSVRATRGKAASKPRGSLVAPPVTCERRIRIDKDKACIGRHARHSRVRRYDQSVDRLPCLTGNGTGNGAAASIIVSEELGVTHDSLNGGWPDLGVDGLKRVLDVIEHIGQLHRSDINSRLTNSIVGQGNARGQDIDEGVVVVAASLYRHHIRVPKGWRGHLQRADTGRIGSRTSRKLEVLVKHAIFLREKISIGAGVFVAGCVGADIRSCRLACGASFEFLHRADASCVAVT
jgi:hypothetical protein